MAEFPLTDATDATEATESRAPSRWRSIAARVLRLVVLFVVLLGLGLTAATLALFYPYVRDDLRIDGIVRTVALDWRDFGRSKADERLRFEFASQSIGRHATPADCVLDDADGTKTVRCEWVVTFRVGDTIWPMDFGSAVRVLPNGDVAGL